MNVIRCSVLFALFATTLNRNWTSPVPDFFKEAKQALYSSRGLIIIIQLSSYSSGDASLSVCDVPNI